MEEIEKKTTHFLYLSSLMDQLSLITTHLSNIRPVEPFLEPMSDWNIHEILTRQNTESLRRSAL